MASLPTIKQILREDIPDAPEWVGSIIDPLNQFMTEVYYALDRDLTLNENIKGGLVSLQFKTRSDYSTAVEKEDGFETQKLANPTKVRPTFVAIGQVTDRDTFAVVTDPISLSWTYLNGVININYIAGLSDSTRYEITFLIF